MFLEDSQCCGAPAPLWSRQTTPPAHHLHTTGSQRAGPLGLQAAAAAATVHRRRRRPAGREGQPSPRRGPPPPSLRRPSAQPRRAPLEGAQPEVIRAIVSVYNPCCGVPYKMEASSCVRPPRSCERPGRRSWRQRRSWWRRDRPAAPAAEEATRPASEPVGTVTYGAPPQSMSVAVVWPSRRRDCHSAATPSTISRCFNREGERASAK